MEELLQNPLTVAFLLVLVMCVNQFVKDATKLQGSAMQWTAFGIGFALALAFQVAQLYPPAAPFVSAGFFCLAVGAGTPGGFSLYKELSGQRKGRTDAAS